MEGPSREMYEKPGGNEDGGKVPLEESVPLMKRQED